MTTATGSQSPQDEHNREPGYWPTHITLYVCLCALFYFYYIFVDLWWWEIQDVFVPDSCLSFCLLQFRNRRSYHFSGRKKLSVRSWLFSPYAIMLSLSHLCSGSITSDGLSTMLFIPVSNLTTDFKKISSVISRKHLALKGDDYNLLFFQQLVAFEWPPSPEDMVGLNQQHKPVSSDVLSNIKSNIEKHHGHHKKMFIPGP